MLEILKEKNKGKIVIIKLGAFYIATEEDAVFLHKKLDLKCNCFKNNICKVGFPANSLEKYIEKLNKLNYSFIIYDIDNERNELIEICSKVGKRNKENNKNINCLYCKGVNKYKEDKYILAVLKELEKDDNTNEKLKRININTKSRRIY